LTGKYSGGKIPADSRLAIKDDFVIQRLRKMLETEEGKKKLETIDNLKVSLKFCESWGILKNDLIKDHRRFISSFKKKKVNLRCSKKIDKQFFFLLAYCR